MKVRSFSHTALTVADFDKTVQFYWEIFGCPVVAVGDTPTERIRAFFGVDAEEPKLKIGWIRCPGGAVLEIFEFQPQQPAVDVPWNRVGLTHISFNVKNTQKWYEFLVSKGVEIVSKPERSPRGHTFFFCKDLDGNLIELIDLKHRHYLLNWGGAFGGWLFRRSMYKHHYGS